ncbi:MAG TPA: hypothetical protein EYP33_00835 [Pyrodictium sp.]|nr:hypothetical protein [Pyrodictium sp.]
MAPGVPWRRRLLTYMAITVAYVCVITMLRLYNLVPLHSGDEKYYIEAGLRYISGATPISINMEHPPLAKYIIGICTGTGITYVCPSLSIAGTVAAIAEVILLITGSVYAWLSVLLAVIADPLFVSLASHNLLDTYMLLFEALAILVYARLLRLGVTKRRLVLLGVCMGAALASKMASLYLLAGIVAHMVLSRSLAGDVRTRARFVGIIVLAATLVYTSAYLVDILRGGLGLLVKHHIEMVEYMGDRHSYTMFVAVNGMLSYMFHIEIWRYIGNITIYITTLDNTTTGISSVEYHFYDKPHPFVKLRPALGNLVLPLTLVLAAAAPMISDRYRRLVSLLHYASMLMLLHGPIWWYLAQPVMTGHMVLAVYPSERRKLKLMVHVAGSIAAWMLYLVLRNYTGTGDLTLTIA